MFTMQFVSDQLLWLSVFMLITIMLVLVTHVALSFRNSGSNGGAFATTSSALACARQIVRHKL